MWVTQKKFLVIPRCSFPKCANTTHTYSVLNSLKGVVHYSNGEKFGNLMAFGYQTFYHGRLSNGPDHLISNHLNTKQVNVFYSDKFVI